MKLATFKHSCKKAYSKGFTAIELVVVLVVIGVIVAIAVRSLGLTDDAKALSAAEEAKYAIAKIQSCHASSPSFVGLDAEIALGRCGAFKDRVTGAGATLSVTNSFGGVRTFAPVSLAGGSNNGFAMGDPQIPYGVCQKYIDTVWKMSNRIDVGTTNVKATMDQVVSPNAVYTACGTSGAVTVTVTGANGNY